MKTQPGIVLTVILLMLAGCAGIQPGYQADEFDLKKISEEPLSPEETRAMFGDLGASWAYGRGMGETAVIVGTIVLFPSIALAYAGNSVLSMTGNEPITLWQFLPEEQGGAARDAYHSVVSVPGRVTSTVAGEEFHDDSRIRARLDPYMDRYRKKVSVHDYLNMGNRER